MSKVPENNIKRLGVGGGGGRHHFRQFCHCNCNCIHKCHHDSETCGDDPDRIHSPVYPLSTTLGHSKSGCQLPSDSLISMVEEIESGRISISASMEDLRLPKESIGEEVRVFERKRRNFGDLILEKDLGEGAYAFVKQGRLRTQTPDSPSIVIKMVIKSRLHPEFILHDFDSGLSLPVELYALRHLREHPHPCIVSMIDVFEDSMYYYIMMPLHGKGTDLFEIIENEVDFLPPKRVGYIFAQAVNAITHLHNVLGLVHRDIKDENFIIDEIDNIQLIDFGSCAYYRGGAPNIQHDVPLTEADVRSGKKTPYLTDFKGNTMEYTAPELLKGQPVYGPQQDIWALGVLLYTLTYKEIPFRSSTDIMNIRLRLPFEADENISRIIKWCLAEVDQRPTASQLANDPWIKENYTSFLQQQR